MAVKQTGSQFDPNYIVELLPTKTDTHEFTEQIDNFLSALYSVKTSIEQKIESEFSSQKKRILMQFVKKYNIDINSPKTLALQLSALTEAIKKIPTISVTLAIEPDERLVNRISTWLRANCETPLIIDVTRKQSTIAGAIIGLNGKYHDYTLRSILKKSVEQPKKI